MAVTLNASTTAGLVQTADTSGVLALQTAGTTAVTVDSSQNVGIGTSSPGSKLVVSGAGFNGGAANFVSTNSANSVTITGVNGASVNDVAYYNFTDGTNNAFIGLTGTNGIAGALRFATGTSPTERMRIDSSGNVGIGTSSPSLKLSVSGSLSVSTQIVAGATTTYSDGSIGTPSFQWNANTGVRVGAVSIADTTSNIEHWVLRNPNGNVASISTNGSAFVFNTASTERMRIDSSGNLCVGVAGNYGNGRITGFHATSGYYTFRSDSSLAAATSWGHFYGTSANNTVANINIFGNGSIQNATGSYAAYSDIKLKENIVDATPKLADLMQVRIRNYNLKGELGYETSKQIGVIAQELEKVFPGLIEEAPDRDSEGNELGTTTKGVKYSIFIPMLIKALQEQQALITALTTRITALETP